jgi:hypothetical protein
MCWLIGNIFIVFSSQARTSFTLPEVPPNAR